MTHVYSDTFFDYIDHGARRSAKTMIGLLNSWIPPQSVLDLGCGRGVWLDEWHKAGALQVLGIDGDYVARDQLAIAQDSFRAADLTQPQTFDMRFDLAQSLEVGEHLPTEASDALVDSLTAASDRVLFSAAVTGQGGEFHVNEQPLTFWQDKFAERGYRAYDCLRPHLSGDGSVEPWYRYNTVFYANDAGAATLPEDITRHALAEGQKLRSAGDLKWRLRRSVVSKLPRGTVTQIAQARAALIAAKARQSAGLKGLN